MQGRQLVDAEHLHIAVGDLMQVQVEHLRESRPQAEDQQLLEEARQHSQPVEVNHLSLALLRRRNHDKD